MKRYYQLAVGPETADLYIYGDITSWPWEDNDVSAAPLVKEIDALRAGAINVYINSYGGEVAEALAIVSALNRSRAKVTTYCDGFACSAAAAIFMAGDERLMSEGSLLFVHRVWDITAGNAGAHQKAADDLNTIDEAALAVYLGKVSITEDALRDLFAEETWILPEDAVSMGFATGLAGEVQYSAAAASARKAFAQRMKPGVEVIVSADLVANMVCNRLSARIDQAILGQAIHCAPPTQSLSVNRLMGMFSRKQEGKPA